MKRQALQLIRFLTQLTPPTIVVPTSRRRRLWGGTSAFGIGTEFAFFGGHNYGYRAKLKDWQQMFPGSSEAKIVQSIDYITYVGFAACAVLTYGVADVTHGYTWLKVLAAGVATTEAGAYAISSKIQELAKDPNAYTILEDANRLERGTLELVDWIQEDNRRTGRGSTERSDIQLLLEGAKRGQSRTMSGSSLVSALLAGFCLNRTGLIGWNGKYWHKNWVSYYAANYVFTSFLAMFLADLVGVPGITGHGIHFFGLAFGYWLGSFFKKFLR